MRDRSYFQEAEYCRDLAAEFTDRSERPFLLRAAEAFGELARHESRRPEWVVGPLGEPLTLAKLPPANTTRWTPRRKAEVLAAVAGGLLSLEEACQRYSLSLEEFRSWQDAIDRGGMRGLRATRIQDYREQL